MKIAADGLELFVQGLKDTPSVIKFNITQWLLKREEIIGVETEDIL